MIMKYINMDFSENDLKLDKALNANEDYREAVKDVEEVIRSLDVELKLKIDEKYTHLETLITDICFDEGFKEGARFAIELLTGKSIEKGC